MQDKRTRDERKRMEDYLDGDLSSNQEQEVERLMETDAAFENEVRVFAMLREDLQSLRGEDPPPFFDRRVLIAATTEAPAVNLAGTAVKMYMALCTLLAAMVFVLTTVLFRGQSVEGRAASEISGLVEDVLGLAAWVGSGIVFGVQSAVDALTPVTTSLRPIVSGVGKAAAAVSPALFPYAVLFLAITSLVLVWFHHSNRKRSIPHATLVL